MLIIDWKKLLKFIAVPLIVGGLSALFTMGAMKEFATVNKPPLSPPAWLFPVVWTVLYILMGISAYLVSESDNSGGKALLYYGAQLFFNFFWSIIFFNLQWYLFAFVWLLVLLLLVVITTVLFYRSSKLAGILMIPYLLWLSFAAYLNLAIYILNK